VGGHRAKRQQVHDGAGGYGGRGACGVGVITSGNHVLLRAEMDVLAVFSDCPQMLNPCNSFSPTDIAHEALTT
jgi:uncharacterized protein YcgI (DUF1989 family)